ncbi:MAG: hypothetical protein HY903_06530 [Deltaproteobacteria bacterium]|nr:hypothetical protein [Deltaproteobacteria bacterium]
MPVKIHVHRTLPKSETFPCTRRQARASLAAVPDLTVDFGLRPHFALDPRCAKPPHLTGTVVASVHFDRDRATRVQLYPVRRADFSAREQGQFANHELPAICKWILQALELPETQLLGHHELLVESLVDGYRRHEIVYPWSPEQKAHAPPGDLKKPRLPRRLAR